MARIRNDLHGSIIVGGHILRAGDEVPDGVRIHPTRLMGAAPVPVETVAEKPHHAAGVAKWRAYATHIGIEVPEDADKTTIRALVAEVEDG